MKINNKINRMANFCTLLITQGRKLANKLEINKIICRLLQVEAVPRITKCRQAMAEMQAHHSAEQLYSLSLDLPNTDKTPAI